MLGGYDVVDVCQVQCVNQGAVNRLKDSMPEVDRLAHLFKVLADETRVKIVYVLSREELCVCDIAEVLGSTPSNVSHHLRQLRNARLVKYRRHGKMVFYSLDDDHVKAIIDQGFRHASHS
jgi:DNA-binding transcriptional ArsR family regulator